MKKSINRFRNTSLNQRGSGDHVGMGIKPKMGKIIDVYGIDQAKPKSFGKPPKSFA